MVRVRARRSIPSSAGKPPAVEAIRAEPETQSHPDSRLFDKASTEKFQKTHNMCVLIILICSYSKHESPLRRLLKPNLQPNPSFHAPTSFLSGSQFLPFMLPPRFLSCSQRGNRWALLRSTSVPSARPGHDYGRVQSTVIRRSPSVTMSVPMDRSLPSPRAGPFIGDDGAESALF